MGDVIIGDVGERMGGNCLVEDIEEHNWKSEAENARGI